MTGCLVLFAAAYLALIAEPFHLPLLADEIAFSAAAGGFWHGQVFLTHPPLYAFLLGLADKAGLAGADLRVIGAACFIANLFLIYAVCRAVAKDKVRAGKIGLLAAFLYLINPMALKGSLILDIDNTILGTITLVFVLAFARLHSRPGPKKYWVLGGILALGFWAKLSTPLLLIAAVFFFYWLKDGLKKSIRSTAVLTAIGAGAFFASWFIIARVFGLPFFQIFYRVGSVLSKGYSQRAFSLAAELADRTTRMALWAGPFFLLLGALPVISGVRAYFRKEPPAAGCLEFIAILFLLIVCGYIVIGGVIYSFPKYHYPMLGLMAVLAASYIEKLGIKFDKRTLPLYAGITAVWGIYDLKVAGDLIYIVNHNLRFLAILDPRNLNEGIRYFAAHAALYLVPVFVAGVFFRVYHARSFARAAALTLLLGTVAAAGALDLTQARAGYFTTYLYGKDIRNMAQLVELIRAVKAKAPKSFMIAPEDAMYEAGAEENYPYCEYGKTKEKFLQAVSDKNVSCVVYGLSWNSIYQYREIFSDPSVLKALKENYNGSVLGEYTVWLRK